MVNDDSAANLAASSENAAAAMEAATIFVFIFQVALSGVLKQLMGALVLLQVVIHMGVLSVQFPGNINMFNT